MTTSDDLPPEPTPASGAASTEPTDPEPTPGPTDSGTSDPGPTTPGPSDPGPAASAFNQIRGWGMTRRTEDSWIGGVASGLAARSGIDPVLMRGLFVLLGLFGIGLLVYGVLWMVLPQSDGRIHLQEAVRGSFSAGFFGALVAIVLGLAPGDSPTSSDQANYGGLALTILVLVGLWMLARRHPQPALPPGYTHPGDLPAADSTASAMVSDTGWHGPAPTGSSSIAAPGYVPPPAVPFDRSAPPRPRKGWSPLVLGIALLGGAAATLLPRADGLLTNWHQVEELGTTPSALGLPLGVSAALAIVALGIVISGLKGRRSGILAPVGWLLVLVLALGLVVTSTTGTSTSVIEGTTTATGEMTWRPTAADPAPYELLAGEATLDLTEPAVMGTVTAKLNVGSLTVILPSDRQVELTTKTNLGSIEISAAASGGDAIQAEGAKLHQTRTLTPKNATGNPEPLNIIAEVGAGEIIVKSASEGVTP